MKADPVWSYDVTLFKNLNHCPKDWPREEEQEEIKNDMAWQHHAVDKKGSFWAIDYGARLRPNEKVFQSCVRQPMTEPVMRWMMMKTIHSQLGGPTDLEENIFWDC